MKHLPSSFGDIFLSADVDAFAHILDDIRFSSGFIICDSNTATYCLPHIANFFKQFHIIIIPPGEANKTLAQCEYIWSQLIAHRADRSSIIINLGGGVISDLGGFAASCFQRGISFIHIPTTVIAMTDAAIGGKLGVDFGGYKNYIGLFNRAQQLWIYPGFLKTLPEAEIKSGMAEVIKHAIIASKPLWEKLQAIHSIDEIDWNSILEISIQVKLDAVAQDPFDQGARKTLNFGHTIGHALESYYLTSGMPLSHGYSVALGMMAESKMAYDLGLIDETTFNNIISMIEHLVQPPVLAIPGVSQLQEWIRHDKKARSGVTLYSLPEGIGACRWDVQDVDAAVAIGWLQEHVSTRTMRLMNNFSND